MKKKGVREHVASTVGQRINGRSTRDGSVRGGGGMPGDIIPTEVTNEALALFK